MKPLTRKLRIVTVLSILPVVVLLSARQALAQQPQTTDAAGAGHAQAPGDVQQIHQTMHGAHAQRQTAIPSMPGQDAFGAIQEIVRLLEADPSTDWSKVDLEALRQHLIDMNEVTLRANAVAKPVDGGLDIVITGAGRTLAAIQRMAPAHAHELNRMNGWSAATALLPNGVRLTVTSADTRQVQHIRGLGFIGLLVSGSHHQPHHLAMAKGEFSHQH